MPKKERTLPERIAACLNRKYYTKPELRRKFLQMQSESGENLYTAAEVEDAVRHLEKLGFINDFRFAEDYAAVLKNRHYGPLRIRRKLTERGISAWEISRVLSASDSEPGQDNLSSALELLQMKTRLYAREPDIMKRKNKALRMLAGKGFPASACYEAVRQWHESNFQNGAGSGEDVFPEDPLCSDDDCL